MKANPLLIPFCVLCIGLFLCDAAFGQRVNSATVPVSTVAVAPPSFPVVQATSPAVPALVPQNRGMFLDEIDKGLVPPPTNVCRCCQKTSRFCIIGKIWTRNHPLQNNSSEHSLFAVRVEVDHPDHVYVKGDLLRVSVESNEDGYLYLFYRDAAGNVAMLYPNRFNRRNAIQKNEALTIPSPGSIFQIRIDAPFGEELLKAIVSKEPLAFFDNLDLTGINMLQIGEEEGTMLAKSVMTMQHSHWASHQVHIRTVDPDAPQNVIAPTQERRARIAPLQRVMFRLKSFSQ